MSTAAAVARIRESWELEPLVGIVLGSGLGGLADELDERVEIPYTEIPGWPVSTAVGHAGTLVLGTLDGVPVAVMRGRAHLYEGVGADRVVFGVRVLGALGIRSLVVTNAVRRDQPRVRARTARPDLRPREPAGRFGARRPERRVARAAFPRHERCIRPRVADAGPRGCEPGSGIELREGVYAAWLGPQFETPAEIRFMRAVGGDLAGMSTVQEVIAARHLGIRVLGIAVVTNMAAGVLPEKIDHEVVLEVGASGGGLGDGAPPRARSYTLASEAPRSALRRRAAPRRAARRRAARARGRGGAHGARPGSDRDLGGERSRPDRRSVRRRAHAGAPPVAPAGAQRDRRSRAHEPRPRAARRRRHRAGSWRSAAATRTSSTTSSVGERGSRQDHLAGLIGRLTGAEAALVVNNNAAAVLLALAALAEGREVVVSRGELIEIGDGFRIPDVLARSGARLVEVGTTNRTRAADYAAAIGPETALAPPRAPVELPRHRVLRAAAARRVGGRRARVTSSRSSTIWARARSAASATSRRLRRASARAPTSSASPGTSSSGGPRRGSSSGRADLVERLRRHPLQRALRADKLTLAALEGTLAVALDPATRDAVPVLRMLHEPLDAVRARAERLAALVGGEVEETVARVGGGALPLAELPSVACAVEEELAEPTSHAVNRR